MSQHQRRQLAAMLFAGIVGYSTIMGADEARAFEAISHFKSIAQPLWKDPLGLRGCGFFHITDGKIKFQRGYWDKLSFLRMHNLPLPTE